MSRAPVSCCLVLASGLVLAGAGGCSGDTCGTKGGTQKCACSTGAEGSQSCLGTGDWGACDCGDIATDPVPGGESDATGGGGGGDSTGGADGTTGPGNCKATTCCDYPFELLDEAKKGIGAACESDGECAYGFCMMPGDPGNSTNDTFGFCTRGCDCNDDPEAKLSADEKKSFFCMLAPGGQGAWHYVAPRCLSPADCDAFDPGWTGCDLRDGSGVTKVCHALSE